MAIVVDLAAGQPKSGAWVRIWGLRVIFDAGGQNLVSERVLAGVWRFGGHFRLGGGSGQKSGWTLGLGGGVRR